ncbi:MAG: thioesterase family protein [Sneathiellaceae bacterium]
MDAVFRLDGDTALPGPFAAGPWNPEMQHGGPPAAMMAWAAERLPAAAPMRVARLNIDLLRPVPLKPLKLASTVVREGRKIQVSLHSLSHDGKEVVRATALKIRSDDSLGEIETGAPPDLPPPEAGTDVSAAIRTSSGFGSGVSMREVRGRFREPGPAAIWYRLDRPILAGQETSALMRAAATADFSNATSALLDFRQWTFINADVSLHLARPPRGEWILLDGESWYGPDGAGLAMTRMADRDGYFGRSVQSLVLERRSGASRP